METSGKPGPELRIRRSLLSGLGSPAEFPQGSPSVPAGVAVSDRPGLPAERSSPAVVIGAFVVSSKTLSRGCIPSFSRPGGFRRRRGFSAASRANHPRRGSGIFGLNQSPRSGRLQNLPVSFTAQTALASRLLLYGEQAPPVAAGQLRWCCFHVRPASARPASLVANHPGNTPAGVKPLPSPVHASAGPRGTCKQAKRTGRRTVQAEPFVAVKADRSWEGHATQGLGNASEPRRQLSRAHGDAPLQRASSLGDDRRAFAARGGLEGRDRKTGV